MYDDDKPKEGWIGIGKWWYASAVFMVVVVLGLVFVLLPIGEDDSTDSGAGSDTGDTTAPVDTPDEPTSPPTDDESPVTPSGFVTLPAPTSKTLGHPTGYPHTPEGAAALVASFASAAFRPDYGDQGDVVTAYTTDQPDPKSLGDQMAATGREIMKIPLNGPAPRGATVQGTLDGIKWKASSGDRVDVAVNMTYTFTNSDGQQWQSQMAYWSTAVWRNGRWWVWQQLGPKSLPELEYVAPGSRAFEDDGWKVVRNDDWTGARR